VIEKGPTDGKRYSETFCTIVDPMYHLYEGAGNPPTEEQLSTDWPAIILVPFEEEIDTFVGHPVE
jgi:hypothetical protein